MSLKCNLVSKYTILFFNLFIMKRKNFISIVVASFVVVALFAGCAAPVSEPEESGEDVIKEGISNLGSVTAYKYNLEINGDVDDEFGANVKFDLNLAGALDSTDEEDPKVDLVAKGSAMDNVGAGGSVDAELKLNKEAMYFNVKSLNVEGGFDLPSEVTDMFGKWWKMTLPPESVGEVSTVLPSGAGEDNPALKKAFEEATLFQSPKFVGTDNIMGESSSHYSVAVDKKGLLNFLKAASEAEGETVSAADMAQAEAQLQNVDINGDVWIGVDSKVVNQFKGKITLNGGEGEMSGVINIDVTIGDINKPVTLSLPSGAEEFPIESLLGPMMMMSDPSMMMDADDSVEMMESDLMMGDEDLEAMMKDLESLEAL